MLCQEALSAEDRQACLTLRQEVFVREQNVPPELEVDGLDPACRHFAVKVRARTIATCRIRTLDTAAKIERVAVAKDFRGMGAGKKLMEHIIRLLAQSPGLDRLKLSSQTHAVPFYEKLGFTPHGSEYLDAGIPHYDMLLKLKG